MTKDERIESLRIELDRFISGDKYQYLLDQLQSANERIQTLERDLETNMNMGYRHENLLIEKLQSANAKLAVAIEALRKMLPKNISMNGMDSWNAEQRRAYNALTAIDAAMDASVGKV